MLRASIFALILFANPALAPSQSLETPVARRLTLLEAVDLALAHNHVVRLARLSVDQKEHAREVARSAYFPQVRNDSAIIHVSDTQLIEIPAGSLGLVGTAAIPSHVLILNQGGVTTQTNGTGVVQPLTELLRVRAANDVARAEAEATRGKARAVEDETALKVRQIYYRMLIADVRRRAVVARIQASEDLQRERVQQVRYGSALAADLIESRARSLQARQELLTTDLLRSDLQIQLKMSWDCRSRRPWCSIRTSRCRRRLASATHAPHCSRISSGSRRSAGEGRSSSRRGTGGEI